MSAGCGPRQSTVKAAGLSTSPSWLIQCHWLPSGSGAAYSGSVDGRFGASFGARFTVRDWDQSTAMNAPGQSGSPASVHYDDLADVWAKGENISLAFTQSAVAAAAAETLILEP